MGALFVLSDIFLFLLFCSLKLERGRVKISLSGQSGRPETEEPCVFACFGLVLHN